MGYCQVEGLEFRTLHKGEGIFQPISRSTPKNNKIIISANKDMPDRQLIFQILRKLCIIISPQIFIQASLDRCSLGLKECPIRSLVRIHCGGLAEVVLGQRKELGQIGKKLDGVEVTVFCLAGDVVQGCVVAGVSLEGLVAALEVVAVYEG